MSVFLRVCDCVFAGICNKEVRIPLVFSACVGVLIIMAIIHTFLYSWDKFRVVKMPAESVYWIIFAKYDFGPTALFSPKWRPLFFHRRPLAANTQTRGD